MMHMTFYWGRKVTLLFDSWSTDSWLSYSLSLLACFVASCFYQYMEDRRLQLKLVATTGAVKTSGGGEDTGVAQMEEPLIGGGGGGGKGGWKKKWSVARIGGAIVFGVNSAVGYMLMLAIMSFNGGVFLAVVLGLSVGYLVFRSGGGEDLKMGVDSPCACA